MILYSVAPCVSIPLKGPVNQFLIKLILYPTPMGAITPLYGGTSPEVGNLNGEYLVPWAQVGIPRSNDLILGKELWMWLEGQVEGREYLAKIHTSTALSK